MYRCVICIICSVPERLVIGPILFSLYIDDTVNVSNKFKYVFAEETIILFSCKTTNNVENIINIELNKIHKWWYKK